MARKQPHPQSGTRATPVRFAPAFALALLVLAVCLPQLCNGTTVFDLAPSVRDAAAGVRPHSPERPAADISPAELHATSVALHTVCTVLVYAAGLTLNGAALPAFIAASLFAVHPAHVDAAARTRALPELLCAAVLLAVLMGGIRVARTTAARAGVFAAAGTAWNVMILLLSRAEEPEASFLLNPLRDAGAGARLMTAVHVFGRYLLLMIWPYRLSPDYSYNAVPVVSNLFSAALLVPFCAAAALAVAALVWGRARPLYGLAGLFFLVSAFPFWNVLDARLPLMAERFAYLPSAAFCLAAAALFRDAGWLARPDWRNPRSVKSIALIAVCLVIPWSVKTYIRSAQWRDEKVLLQAAARTVPDSAQVQLLLGNLYMREGNIAAAQRSYRRALGIYPGSAAAAVHLGAACRISGEYAEAYDVLRRVEPSETPLRAERSAELGRVHFAMNEYRAAAAAYEDAVALDDTDADTHLELGTVYLQFLGEPARGRTHLRRSLELAPDQPRASEIRQRLNR